MSRANVEPRGPGSGGGPGWLEVGLARSEGQVVERRWRSGRGFALRFLAYGERRYVTLGREGEGWDRRRAELELQNVMADVRRGVWIAPDRNQRPKRPGEPLDGPGELSFHRFASEWFAGRRGEVSDRTREYSEWALTLHLLPYFATWRLADIDVEAVDAYRRHKTSQAEQRPLSDRHRPASGRSRGAGVAPAGGGVDQ